MSSPDRARGEQRAMSARVHDVEAGGDDPDDAPAGVERTLVHGAVDADGQPAHHGHAGARQGGAEVAGVVETVGRCRARADHRHARTVESTGVGALGEEHLRPVGELLVERIAGPPGDVDARCPGHQVAGGAVARAPRRSHARASDCRAGSSTVGAPSHSTAAANPRSSPASAPIGPPPRSTSARNRFDGSCRAATPTSPPPPPPDPTARIPDDRGALTVRLRASRPRSRGGRR